jgi:hypothetical protein
MKPRLEMRRSGDRVAVVFIVIVLIIILFLPVAIARYLQTPLEPDASTQIQEGIAVLQETTEELRETVEQLQGNVEDSGVEQDLEAIDHTLEEVSKQLEQLENELLPSETVVPAVVEDPVDVPEADVVDESRTFQDELLQLIGWAVGLLSIIIAVLLATLSSARRKRRRRVNS